MPPVPTSSSKTRSITVIVPRHGAQRPGVELAAAVERVVRKEALLKQSTKKRRKTQPVTPLIAVRSGYARKLTTQEGTDPLAAAIESASEWNSLLLTARAERGPQFDVATQQFHVDEDSELYYNHTPLREALESEKPAPKERAPPANAHPNHASISARVPPSAIATHTPHLMRHPQGGMPAQSPVGPHPGAFGGDPRFGGMPPMSAPPQAAYGGGHAMMGGGGVPPGQFYGGPPAQAMSMQPHQMHVDPAAAGAMPFGAMHDQRRMTRGMSQGMIGDGFGMGMYGS